VAPPEFLARGGRAVLGDPQASQPVAYALPILMLFDPELSVLGAVPNLPEVSVDALDQ
jgi:hypothetical protein